MPRPDETLAAKVARGEYDLIDPLDYVIIDKIPDAGTTMGGLYPLGSTIKSLLPHFQGMDTNNLSARFRSLSVQGLVVKVKLAGTMDTRGAYAWQRTPKAVELLNKWKESHP